MCVIHESPPHQSRSVFPHADSWDILVQCQCGRSTFPRELFGPLLPPLRWPFDNMALPPRLHALVALRCSPVLLRITVYNAYETYFCCVFPCGLINGSPSEASAGIFGIRRGAWGDGVGGEASRLVPLIWYQMGTCCACVRACVCVCFMLKHSVDSTVLQSRETSFVHRLHSTNMYFSVRVHYSAAVQDTKILFVGSAEVGLPNYG